MCENVIVYKVYPHTLLFELYILIAREQFPVLTDEESQRRSYLSEVTIIQRKEARFTDS